MNKFKPTTVKLSRKKARDVVLLWKLQEFSKTGNHNLVLTENDRIVHVMNNFFIWLKHNEYVYYENGNLYKTGFIRRTGVTKKKLLNWKKKLDKFKKMESNL